MNLHRKDLMLDFYSPILKRGGKGRSSINHLSITQKTGKSMKGQISFFRRFREEFGSIERLSVKFTGDNIFFVFNVPIDKGVPFYKVVDRKEPSLQQLGNSDLGIQIFNFFKLTSNCRVYFDLELHTDFDNLKFYELKLKEVIKLDEK